MRPARSLGQHVLTNGGLSRPGLRSHQFLSGHRPNVNLRVKTVANGASNSGQTQGWLASFQLPGITTEIVTPPAVGGNIAPTTTVNTLNPPTIPNYIVLQPLTCPQQAPNATDTCLPGSNVSVGINGTGFTSTSPAPAPFVSAALTVLPPAFRAPRLYWQLDRSHCGSDQQVYVVGQIGLTGTRGRLTLAHRPVSLLKSSASVLIRRLGSTVVLDFCPALCGIGSSLRFP